jgi:IS5 family transposase
LFGYRKVRYLGIAMNGAQLFALIAIANVSPANTHSGHRF